MVLHIELKEQLLELVKIFIVNTWTEKKTSTGESEETLLYLWYIKTTLHASIMVNGFFISLTNFRQVEKSLMSQEKCTSQINSY